MNDTTISPLPAAPRSSIRRDVVWIASVALVYFTAARLSLLLANWSEGIPAIWPCTGIFLSSLLLTRRGLRPWLAGVLFLTDFLVENLAGTPVLVSALYSLALTGDAVLSAWLLERFVGRPFTFQRVRDVIAWLVFSVLFSNLVWSLLAGAASDLLPGEADFFDSVRWWVATDGVGNLLVTPLILGWAVWTRTEARAWHGRRLFEGAVLLCAPALVTYLLIRGLAENRLFGLFLPYAIFPFVTWGAMRFGVRGVTTTLITVAAVVFPFAMAGEVPSFSFAPGVLDDVLFAQLFLAAIAVPGLFLAVVVTEREQAHRAQVESEAHLQTILDQGEALVYTLDMEGRFTLVNRRVEEVIGRPAAEILGRTREAVLPADIAATHRANDLEVIRAGQPVMREEVNEQPDGRHVYISNKFPLRDESGAITGVCGIYTDITERTAHATELALQAARFQAVFERAPVGISLSVFGKGVTLVNAEHARLTGVPMEDSCEPGVFDRATLPEDHVRQMVAARKFIAGEEDIYTVEKRYLHPDGRLQWVELTSRYFPDLLTGEKWIVTTLVDIAERKAAGAERERLLAQAESSRRALLSVVEDQTLAEMTLRESEERFRVLFQDISSVSIQGYAGDGTTRFWNGASEQLYGYSAKEAVGRNLLDLIIPDEMREGVKAAVRQMADTGQPIPPGELTLRRKDGSSVEVYSCHAVVQTKGRPSELFCIDVDLTALKAAQKALGLSEARHRSFLEQVNVPVCHVAKDGVIDFRNGKFLEIIGYSRDEVPTLTEWWLQAYPDPDYRQLTKENWLGVIGRATKSAPEVESREYKINCKSGEVRVFEISGIVLNDGVLVSFFDVTERHKAEQAVRLSEENYRESITAAGLVPYVVNYAERRFEFIGGNIESLTGFRAAEVTPDLIKRLMVESSRPGNDAAKLSYEEASEKFRAGDIEHWSQDLLITTRSGEKRWLNDSSVPVRDSGGKVIQAIGVFQDLTARKLAEMELRDLTVELEQRVHALSRFHQQTVGRELRMIELKSEVNELCEKLGEPSRHVIVQAPGDGRETNP